MFLTVIFIKVAHTLMLIEVHLSYTNFNLKSFKFSCNMYFITKYLLHCLCSISGFMNIICVSIEIYFTECVSRLAW